MKIGFLDPHLRRYGVRRILKFSNRFVARGHPVTIYVPLREPLRCGWMTCRARIRHSAQRLRNRLLAPYPVGFRFAVARFLLRSMGSADPAYASCSAAKGTAEVSRYHEPTERI